MKLTHNFLVLPNNSFCLSEILRKSGRSQDDSIKTIQTTGISEIRSAHPKLLTEFIFDGLDAIQLNNCDIFGDIDGVIVVSQSYDQRIPSISTQIQKKLKLKSEAFCIDLMDGCSGYIKALSIASMLNKKEYKKILIVSGDINSMMTNDADIGTKILFGDGVSFTILEAASSKIDTQIFNDGDDKNIISCSVDESIMNMDGFEVFRFTKNVVPKMINKYLLSKKITMDHFDLVSFHQASKLVVSTICKSLNYKNKLGNDFNCGKIGNLGAGSIGAWLSNIENLDNLGALNMLAVGYGSGLSWGLAALTIDIKTNEVFYV